MTHAISCPFCTIIFSGNPCSAQFQSDHFQYLQRADWNRGPNFAINSCEQLFQLKGLATYDVSGQLEFLSVVSNSSYSQHVPTMFGMTIYICMCIMCIYIFIYFFYFIFSQGLNPPGRCFSPKRMRLPISGSFKFGSREHPPMSLSHPKEGQAASCQGT